MADDEKKQECPPGAPIWMCTFADLMSLLLCFFVLLLSFSVMDAQQYYKVAGSMKDAFGVQRDVIKPVPMQGEKMISATFESVPLHVQIQVARSLSEDISQHDIEADYTENGLILRVKGGIAFDSGRATIKKDFLPFLDKLGKLAVEKDLAIEVSGHTDNVPLKKGQSSYRTNWSLSSARAVGVVEYWLEKMKIPPQKLSAVAYADGRPLASNDSAEGRAANRRVEFKIRPANPKVIVTGIELEQNPVKEVIPDK
ncbi:MAG: OmpA family protein [Desulfobulbaceae bacterium]|nr:OmpA family protein [Desulfobulbaceae bacterium]